MTIDKGTNEIRTKDEEHEKDFNEYGYVMAFKTKFHQELFPNDFDKWNIKEQCDWINEHVAKFFPNEPGSLLHLLSAAYHKGDCGRSPVEVPEWLDMDKYRRGQAFVHKYYMSTIIAKVIGLTQIYSFEDGLKPIIMTGRSHTLFSSFIRYRSTLQRIYSWYDGHPWVKGTPAYNDMQSVRKMHLAITAKLGRLDNEQIDNASKIAKPWCPDRELFLKDFAAACPFEKQGQCPYSTIYKSPYREKGINSTDMAGTQCSIIAPILLFPQDIGIYDASDEDLEAFCHMWRCYGYLLGMEDKYNFCRGNLEEIRQRTRDFYQYWMMPNFKNVTTNWEHMTRCFIESLNYYPLMYMSYKTLILIGTGGLDMNMPNTYASLNYTEWITYKVWTVLFRYGFKVSIIRLISNKIMRKTIEAAVNYGPEKLAELQKKSKIRLSNFCTTYQQ